MDKEGIPSQTNTPAIYVNETFDDVVTPRTRPTANTSDEQETSKSRTTTRTREERRLRTLLKVFFYRPVKWENSTCYIHIIYLIIFAIQIIKLSLLTKQMLLYGNDRAKFNSIVHRGHLTLRHLLLKGWDASWETVPYPPAHGDFAVYTINSLEEGIDFAVQQYYNAEIDAIGYYKRVHSDSMDAIVKYFDFPGFHDADVDKGIDINEKHFSIEHGLTKVQTDSGTVYNYSIADELEFLNLSQPMKRMLTTTLKFNIHSVRPHEKTKHALCLSIKGEVTFTDIDNNGQVHVDLDTLTSKINCHTMNVSVEDLKLEYTSIPISKAVLVFCVISIVITVLTFIFGIYVCIKTKLYMKKNYKQYFDVKETAEESDLPVDEYLRFLLLKLWDIPLLISDCFTVYGTYWVVFGTEGSDWVISLLDSYTVILGMGCILAWLSMLRYFKVHNKFHLLFSTLSRAISDVIAYMICVTVLFVGFWICGYVVLGPYNVKFETPASTAETLFALVNGDEIFATIAMFDDDQTGSSSIGLFARFYIGVYVCIYTIVVINVLVALFLSAYDAIKAEPGDKRLGPLEKAIQDVIREKDGQQIRSSFYDLLSPDGHRSRVETTLRDELQNIIKINEKSREIENVKLKTLKSFIRDEIDKRLECSIGFCKFSMSLFVGEEPYAN
ncbi:Mucolipin-2 [Mactra antiquata]